MGDYRLSLEAGAEELKDVPGLVGGIAPSCHLRIEMRSEVTDMGGNVGRGYSDMHARCPDRRFSGVGGLCQYRTKGNEMECNAR